ncbi:hypothetical protein RSA46_12885 [Pseudomonas oryzihabitans]|nr:hypothetical protein NS376_20315 [Pseudomonas psychrotolerans]KTT41240.1 hypothetical protein SB5_03455 [Pseudomonas psychrotolerans]KTT44189.1 hypothetical protein RSA46_12885 [Pseudomonas psychrotolerans]
MSAAKPNNAEPPPNCWASTIKPSQPNLRLRESTACSPSPLSLRERVRMRALHTTEHPGGKGCAVFHATVNRGQRTALATPAPPHPTTP